jgi:protein phosphatase 1L
LTNPVRAIREAYESTDNVILEKASELGVGGSTAVTAILMNGRRLIVANVGDSRAVLCRGGAATQLSVDHEPESEKRLIESKGGFVSVLPGKVSLSVAYIISLTFRTLSKSI